MSKRRRHGMRLYWKILKKLKKIIISSHPVRSCFEVGWSSFGWRRIDSGPVFSELPVFPVRLIKSSLSNNFFYFLIQSLLDPRALTALSWVRTWASGSFAFLDSFFGVSTLNFTNKSSFAHVFLILTMGILSVGLKPPKIFPGAFSNTDCSFDAPPRPIKTLNWIFLCFRNFQKSGAVTWPVTFVFVINCRTGISRANQTCAETFFVQFFEVRFLTRAGAWGHHRFRVEVRKIVEKFIFSEFGSKKRRKMLSQGTGIKL